MASAAPPPRIDDRAGQFRRSRRRCGRDHRVLLDAGVKPQNAAADVRAAMRRISIAISARTARWTRRTCTPGCRRSNAGSIPRTRRDTTRSAFGEGRALTELLQKLQGSSRAAAPRSPIARMGYRGTLREVDQVHHRHQRSAISAMAAAGPANSPTGSTPVTRPAVPHGEPRPVKLLSTMRRARTGAGRVRGCAHGFARRTHAVCGLVVDGRPADAGGAAALMIAGIVLSLAASPPVATRLGLDPFYFVNRHVLYLRPTLVVMIALVPAAAAHPPARARRVHRQPRDGRRDAGFRRRGEGRAALDRDRSASTSSRRSSSSRPS